MMKGSYDLCLQLNEWDFENYFPRILEIPQIPFRLLATEL